MTQISRTVDDIVVGAGSGGCALAARLSENPDRTVLLLEAGEWDAQSAIHEVRLSALLGLWRRAEAEGIDWGYVTEPEPFLGGRRVPVARGKVVGGSGSVNALMWVRGNRRDFDEWRRLGNRGWSYRDLLPCFKRAEDYRGRPSPYRGVRGPIGVHDHTAPTPVAQGFVDAAAEAGFPGRGQDYNGPEQEGFGFLYQTTRTGHGTRCSTATGYLRPALSRRNLTVLTGARATRLLLRAGRARGVTYVRGGRTRTVRARGEIVLCAGTFETPKLLMLSGIGPAARLAEHGIPCLMSLPGVGEGLQDHPFVSVCEASPTEHPEAELVSEAGLFVRVGDSAETLGRPDVQFSFGTAKFLPADAVPADIRGPGFTLAATAVRPRSRGRVALRSADPEQPATVLGGYLSCGADTDTLVRGLELARELIATEALRPFRGVELCPGPSVRTRKELRAHVTANASTLWHPVGTCRMGADPQAVVDAELRVHGVDGLRIADASVMPTITTGNTNAPVVMIAEKAADLMRATTTGSNKGVDYANR
ncbi:GMC family oxidoreductase [Streptomyces beihaiensis]|uniref:GMC family oxidoreductase N-terminal domain-containing protein n=1 Tax=Streptomyces beihaiensis TaxID=2984495 RepID=A0ABT3TSY6_9ACTN|nr:GMC family oxidoreductase N-terminal domain-containing protein [Streptomyces beihaiensis]MCX3060164.1 GMC family oxidoreductase N-terminal domain-containing protein [Streptomyces beihaiensis]